MLQDALSVVARRWISP